ncbi:MAG TPA: hypothetical protein VH796_11345 [Nitrososphaeraceae archaeon]
MPYPWSTCKRAFNYDATNISFSGLQAPDQLINFKIGSFQVKKDLLQAACEIAQIYDLFQYSNCQRIQQFSKDSKQRDTFILEIQKNESRLVELLSMLKLAAAHPSERIEEAIADWIAFTYTKKIREEAPIIPEKVRAGEVVRESPPPEVFNSVKRSIAKAKMSSTYLISALENPNFDLNKVYALGL